MPPPELEPSVIKAIIIGEHEGDTTPPTKRVLVYGWTGSAKVRLKVDSNGNVIIGQPASSIGDGNVTTTAGTAKKLIAASTPCKRVIVHAVGGHIVVGAVSCDYTAASRKGVIIHKTQSMEFFVDDVSKLYVDSAANVLVAFYYEV